MGTVQHDLFGTATVYFKAFQALQEEGIHGNHLALLKAHFNSPKHTATWAELAKAVGYATGGAVNMQYGTLARRVAEQLGIVEPPKGFWLYVLAEWGNKGELGHQEFVLRRPVIQALSRLGILPKTKRKKAPKAAHAPVKPVKKSAAKKPIAKKPTKNPAKKAAKNAPQSARASEDERAAVKKALMTLSDSELQVIAHSPAGDLLHNIAQNILGDRLSQPTPLPINEAKTENLPQIEAVSENTGSKKSDACSLDQVPNTLLAVRHGRKYRDGTKWVLATKKGVYIRTFVEEAALDQWWEDFQHSQQRRPLPLSVGPAEKKSGDAEMSNKAKRRLARQREFSWKTCRGQGQTRKVGSRRSSS